MAWTGGFGFTFFQSIEVETVLAEKLRIILTSGKTDPRPGLRGNSIKFLQVFQISDFDEEQIEYSAIAYIKTLVKRPPLSRPQKTGSVRYKSLQSS